MFEFIVRYWYMFIFSFVLGAFLYGFNQSGIKNVYKRFSNRAPLIKRYWLFVVPFFILSVLLFFLLLKYSPANMVSTYTTILSQFLTLIFAIFIGYFAFLQLIENRADKLHELGDNYLREKSYLRAISYYKEAHSIDSKDFSILANLAELYLIIQDFISFEEKLDLLNKSVIENSEKIIPLYLKATEYLLKQHKLNATEEINRCVNFIKKCPNALIHFSWNFSDVKNSPAYLILDGELKDIMDNFIKYLSKELNPEQKERFEAGNYLLTEKEAISN